MRSLLERPVSFRLSAESYSKYEAAAAQLGMRLSQYLRLRLDVDDSVSEQVSQLRLTMLDVAPNSDTTACTNPALVELLLLVRRGSSPGELRAVHNELERQGLTPWSPESA
ncbi:hypothetical protein [Achromobacter sp.]|uniref:hypothetical protein n=1 Tax=Achromobacter sp. TaxID=134375 RepID=UPI0025873E26|nr:hypothetical protein [Achromobacter sp.]